ncbi:MAG: hypothetical protein QOI10_2077 [Solirubrobacterales bacterium]|jgi:hypothetical protein|nr:hypothetical protein [Solirubrobacterales bacterium]
MAGRIRELKRTGPAIAALAATLALVAAPAEAKPKVSVLGWTTQAGSSSPQVKNKETIEQCFDSGLGQRNLYVVVRGKGIAKGTKVGIGVWGGPPSAGFSEEPSDADVKKGAFKWPSNNSYTTSYGYSFATGPFGPTNIDGEWNAKVLVKGKQAAKGQVTVACA